MTRFKVGAARLRDGTEAVIYRVDVYPSGIIHGAVVDALFAWRRDGRLYDGRDSGSDLMPNVSPIRVEWETKVVGAYPAPMSGYLETHAIGDLLPLLGKRVRVVCEEIE